MKIAGYDKWKLRGPDEIYQPYIGSKPGDTCNRVAEPDEDAPRGYRPRPCAGVMVQACGEVVCETCGEFAE
jgi:hypothetical protein